MSIGSLVSPLKTGQSNHFVIQMMEALTFSKLLIFQLNRVVMGLKGYVSDNCH